MSVEKCQNAALRYVAMQIKTEGQVKDYLKRKEFEPEEIEEAILFLREYKYVDDVRYCQSYYKEACRKGRGRRRIEQELQKKKVDRWVIRDVLDQFLSEDNPDYDDVMEEILSEKDRALIVGQKMLRMQRESGKEADKNFLAKVGRRLVSLGYGTDVVYFVIGILMKESQNHDGERTICED